MIPISPTKSLARRMSAAIDRSAGPDACWPWRRCRGTVGYGRISIDGKTVQAHRVALVLSMAPPHPDAWALHHCDNPPCCNPKHLYWGTPADNARDAFDRKRITPPVRNPLKPETKETIRVHPGADARSLAFVLGVSVATVLKIRREAPRSCKIVDETADRAVSP